MSLYADYGLSCARLGVASGHSDKMAVSLLTRPSEFPASPLTSREFVKAFTSVPSAELRCPLRACAMVAVRNYPIAFQSRLARSHRQGKPTVPKTIEIPSQFLPRS